MKGRGRLRMVVRSAAGDVVAERHAENTVLRQGALVVARLFSGAAEGHPISQIQLGFGTEAADVEATALTPPPTSIPTEALRGPITADSFSVATDRPRTVQVSVVSLFHPTVDLPNVSEAGLLAGELLYNQVIFEPVTLRVGQDVSFFWDVDFPFGQ